MPPDAAIGTWVLGGLGASSAGGGSLSLHAWIAVGVLVVAMTLFITKLVPLWVTALSIPVVLAATGTLEPARVALAGFGNGAVIALAGVFILGAGLEATGVATIMGHGLERLGGRSETRIVIVIMVLTAVMSAFLSNAATVAVLLPAVAVLGRRTQIPVSRLMMPLAYAAILGGTLTLIGTTPHLILAEEMRERVGRSLGVFEFAKIGAPVAAIGILYMATIGVRQLPKRRTQDRLRAAHVPEELARSYGFEGTLYRMRVVDGSHVVGKTIRDAAIRSRYQLDVILVFRPGAPLAQRYEQPSPDLVIQAEDHLYLEGRAEDAWHFAEEEVVQFGFAGPKALERILGRGVTLGELTLAPRADAIGKTLRDLEFRKRTGLNVLSIWRRDRVLTTDVATRELRLGDAFLVSGPPARLRAMRDDPDFILLGDHVAIGDRSRAPIAALAVLVALLPPLFGWLPLALSVIAGGLLMVLTGCLSPAQARRAVDWQILFLLIGTIPLGIALDQQGVAAHVASGILGLREALGEPGILAALYLLAALLSTTSNNAATAVILAPVAAQVATAGDIDLSKAFLAVAYGTSCAFLLPFAHQCNLMVMGPGGYETRDFARVGLGMSLVTAAGTIALLSLF